MKFYDRINELSILQENEQQSYNSAVFTVLMGRRRVGKTSPNNFFYISPLSDRDNTPSYEQLSVETAELFEDGDANFDGFHIQIPPSLFVRNDELSAFLKRFVFCWT